MTEPEPRPPWVVFPDLDPPTLALNQGVPEAWLDQVWQPFWSSLGPAERAAYLDRWNAPPAWRETIAEFDAMWDAAARDP